MVINYYILWASRSFQVCIMVVNVTNRTDLYYRSLEKQTTVDENLKIKRTALKR